MGDIIIRLNGVDIVSSSDLQRLLDGLVRGQSVQVTVLRDGREINLMMISE
jgi:type II secretory pathway component PulC